MPWWLGNVRADWVQQLFRGSDGTEIGDEPTEVRIRMALAELGTTYIKLGQILSTRPDLVGPELAAELSKLQSDTPADPPEVVHETLSAELGQTAEELYLEFDDTAMASSSIVEWSGESTTTCASRPNQTGQFRRPSRTSPFGNLHQSARPGHDHGGTLRRIGNVVEP